MAVTCAHDCDTPCLFCPKVVLFRLCTSRRGLVFWSICGSDSLVTVLTEVRQIKHDHDPAFQLIARGFYASSQAWGLNCNSAYHARAIPCFSRCRCVHLASEAVSTICSATLVASFERQRLATKCGMYRTVWHLEPTCRLSLTSSINGSGK